MVDLKPVFTIIGVLLSALAVGMVAPALVDAVTGNPDWLVFAVSAGITLFVGVAMALATRSGGIRLSIYQALVMTTLSWLLIAFFAALPLAFSELNLSYTDAFFEAMSGITTTGSTVISGLDTAPPGILLWRALLQWLGGIGIIIMAIAIFPMLRVGGMQLFRMESSEHTDRTTPQATRIISSIIAIYLALTLILALAYRLAGMSAFNAIVHAMTTISTGGFSTMDGSIGYMNSPGIEIIAIIGMVIGGLPFMLYLKAMRNGPAALWNDTQVQWFISIIIGVVLSVAVWLWLSDGLDPLLSLRYAAFNVVSIITGTGYTTSDYGQWGGFAVAIFFFIMFVGGCAGSTTGGIKIFRFQVIYAAARTQINSLLRPHGVFTPHQSHRPIPDEVVVSVLSFFFLFGISFALLAIGLGLSGLDFITAISSAATAISNVGPALGSVAGPSGTFQSLPDVAKWLLAAGMLIGRLELFAVITIFTRSFWRG